MDRMLELAFVNFFDDVQINHCDFHLVKLDKFHPPFEIAYNIGLTDNIQIDNNNTVFHPYFL